jgi:hypothetical protein
VPTERISIELYIGSLRQWSEGKTEEPLNLFSSENIVGRLNQEERDGRLMKCAYNIYKGESEAQKPLVNPRRRWKDIRNIKININEREMKVGLKEAAQNRM